MDREFLYLYIYIYIGINIGLTQTSVKKKCLRSVGVQKPVQTLQGVGRIVLTEFRNENFVLDPFRDKTENCLNQQKVYVH